MARLFISQERLDTWNSEDKVTIEGDLMTLAEHNRSFRIRPAVHFIGITGSDEDPHDLLGTVKDEEDLAAMGADHMANSVIYVDTAYEVMNGFLGDPLPKD